MKTLKMTTGELVRLAMRKAVKPAVLGSAVAVSTGTVESWISGAATPSLTKLRALRDYALPLDVRQTTIIELEVSP